MFKLDNARFTGVSTPAAPTRRAGCRHKDCPPVNSRSPSGPRSTIARGWRRLRRSTVARKRDRARLAPVLDLVPSHRRPGGSPAAHPLREAFLQGLRDLGYVEGRTVVIEYRYDEDKLERLPVSAAELVALKVDVIVTGGGTPTALAAKQATRSLPIVFSSATDPVTDGLVTSLARPEGNVTGLASFSRS